MQIKWRALALAAAGCAFAGNSFAADSGSEETLQEVVITGSRIVVPNQTSTSPIQVVTSAEISLGGRADVSDVIMQLPQNMTSVTSPVV
jgi:outer membrane cobalamin receptor